MEVKEILQKRGVDPASYDVGYGLTKGGVAVIPAALAGLAAQHLGAPAEITGLSAGLASGILRFSENFIKFVRETRLINIKVDVRSRNYSAVSRSDKRFLYRMLRHGSISQRQLANALIHELGLDVLTQDGEGENYE